MSYLPFVITRSSYIKYGRMSDFTDHIGYIYDYNFSDCYTSNDFMSLPLLF